MAISLVYYQLSRCCPDQSLRLRKTGEVIHPLIPTSTDTVTTSGLTPDRAELTFIRLQ